MNWIEITSPTQLTEIENSPHPCLIFKHSTRCVVSKIVKANFELESVLIPNDVLVYHLDLIKYRDLSAFISEKWAVKHESPQILLIQNNTCHYDESHNNIHVADVVTKINR